MDSGRIDEAKLINTLKGILRQFLPDEEIPMEKQVRRYLDIKLKNLSGVTNSDGDGIFFIKDGKSRLVYNNKTKNLTYLVEDLLNIMKMFKIDEDIAEEIFKKWFQSNFGLEVNLMYNQN